MTAFISPTGLLAYFITFATYGSRLHGDERGSVRRGTVEVVVAPDRWMVAAEARLMRDPAFILDERQRQVVADTVVETCKHRDWGLVAVNVRTNHVHAVVVAGVRPEEVVNAFKAWSTRRLRERGLVDRERQPWTRHGSTRYLWDEKSVESAVEYVVNGQGADIPGSTPMGFATER